MLGTGSDGQRLLQLRAGLGDVARVDQRYAVGVILLGGAETDRGRLEPAVAHNDVQLSALGDVAFGAFGCLLEEHARLGELPRVEKPDGGLERGELREGGEVMGCFRSE